MIDNDLKNVDLTIPLLSYYKNYKKNYNRYFSKLAEENGDCFNLQISFYKFTLFNVHYFSSGPHIKHVLFDNSSNYIKPLVATGAINGFLGNLGLFTTDDYIFWKQERTILNPSFKEDVVRKYAEKMVHSISNSLDTWNEYAAHKKTINIDNAITDMTRSVLLNTLFGGVKLDSTEVKNILHNVDYFTSLEVRLFRVLMNPLLPYTLKYRKTKKLLNILGKDIITQCLSDKCDENNIIRLLHESYQQLQLPADQIQANLLAESLTFLSAGHQTISALLVKVCVYLSLYPVHKERIKEEIAKIIGNNNITLENFHHLSYTQSVIKETLRINPIFHAFLRQAIADDAIGSYQIKKGELVFISPYQMHHLEKYWENPEGFDPTRFLHPLDDKYKYLYIPFGAGHRSCIGQHFVLMEATIAIAMIIQRYDLSLTPWSSIEKHKYVILDKFNSDIEMTVRCVKK